MEKKVYAPAELEMIAKNATCAALAAHLDQLPPDWQIADCLTLRHVAGAGKAGFEFYLPARDPRAPEIFSCAQVDQLTGEVAVEVFVSS